MAEAGLTSVQPNLMMLQVGFDVDGSDADSDSPDGGWYYFGHVDRRRHMQMEQRREPGPEPQLQLTSERHLAKTRAGLQPWMQTAAWAATQTRPAVHGAFSGDGPWASAASRHMRCPLSGSASSRRAL